MYSDRDQDKEDKEGPDDFNKQLNLQKEETNTKMAISTTFLGRTGR